MKTLVLAGLFALLATLAARAGTHTWTGGSTSGLWSNPSNWANNDAPALGESPLHLVFPTNATRRLATNNFGGLVVNSITFHGAAYTLAGLGAGTNLTVDSSVGNSWWNIRAYSGTGHTLHYSLNLLLDGNLEFNIATNASVTVRSRLSAATANSGVSKDGPGTVALDPVEDNTFDGTTRILDGTLRLEGSHVGFGGFTVTDVTVPGALLIGGNSLAQQPRCLVWLANQIGDNSSVTVNRNGELLLADVNDAIGSLTMAGGIVDTANGKLTLNGNVLIQNPPSGTPSQILGYLDLGTVGRFFTVETNAYVDVSAIISGRKFGNVPAGVNKLGPGWMAFTSISNSFGGELYISAGTVSIRSGKQIGAPTNAASVATGGTLALSGIGFGPTINDKKLNLQAGARLLALLDSEWNGPVQLYGKAILDVPTNTTLTIGGVISGTGGFNKVNTGELLLTGFEDNTFTGPACVDDGLLSLDKVGLFTNAIAISGPLIVGTNDDTKLPIVSLFDHEEIAPTVAVTVNQNGALWLNEHNQTVATLAVNGGVVNSGILGLLKLAGDITSTNDLTHYGRIQGRLSLGNSPRTISVWGNGGWLNVFAVISGGPAATLTKGGGDNNLELYGANTYEGLTDIGIGSIVAHHPKALGSSAAGTVVELYGSLMLDSYYYGQADMTVTNEALTLIGPASDSYNGAMASFGTNNWQGVVTLVGGDTVIRAERPQDTLVLSVRVEGVRNLTKTGKGKLIFSGVGLSAFNNTYTGTTTVSDGELILAKHGAIFANTALAGNLNIIPYGPGSFPIVRVQGRQQFLGTNAVTLVNGGQLRIESPTYNSVGSLSGGGFVDFAPGSRLVCGLNNQNTTYSGTLQGGGFNDTNFVKYGSGILTLDGANGLSSRVHVGGGTLRVNSTQPIARYDVTTPGILAGNGSIYNVTMRGGYLAPGSPIGKLHAASCTIAASHWMNFELNGAIPGTGYDQFEVDEAPDLSFSTLGTSFGTGFNPTNGQTFLILRNNSAQPVTKPFFSAPEGAQFYVDANHRVQITYLGGDGNDVVLSVVAGPGQLKGITTDGNRATINGCGTPGASYHVEATTNVVDSASWVNIGTLSAGSDGLMQFVDGDMAQYPHRFYRFVAP